MWNQTFSQKIMDNKKLHSEAAVGQRQIERTETLKSHIPVHPILNRMRSKLMENNGLQVISSYDRMHHRHNRS